MQDFIQLCDSMKYPRFLSKMIKTNSPVVCPLCFFVIFAVLVCFGLFMPPLFFQSRTPASRTPASRTPSYEGKNSGGTKLDPYKASLVSLFVWFLLYGYIVIVLGISMLQSALRRKQVSYRFYTLS